MFAYKEGEGNRGRVAELSQKLGQVYGGFLWALCTWHWLNNTHNTNTHTHTTHAYKHACLYFDRPEHLNINKFPPSPDNDKIAYYCCKCNCYCHCNRIRYLLFGQQKQLIWRTGYLVHKVAHQILIAFAY